MVPLPHLALPILVSAVLVFVASAILHMALRHHTADYHQLPNEDAVRAAFTATGVGPGQYIVPYATSPKEMGTPAMLAKLEQGPVGLFILRRPGKVQMTPYLVQWFIYTLVISYIVAYVTGRTLAPGAPYLAVFRVAGTAAVLAYAARPRAGRHLARRAVGRDRPRHHRRRHLRPADRRRVRLALARHLSAVPS